jgi:WD40 repeat protein
VWNVATRKVARLLQRPGGVSEATAAVAFSPNDRLLATAEGDGNIWIYNLRTGDYTNATTAQGSLQTLDFSSDGRFLAAAGLAGQITVLNLKHGITVLGTTQNDVRTINHGPLIYTLGFSPHGDTIAAGDNSGDVDFWNADTGQQLPQQIADPGGGVTSLSYDPSGNRLLTIGADGSIRLWALPTDEPIGTSLPGATTSGSGAFFPNGKEIVAVFGSGTGVLWNVDPTRWGTQACRIAGRNLTRAEWRSVLPNRAYNKVCP